MLIASLIPRGGGHKITEQMWSKWLSQIGIKIETHGSNVEVKKCGFRMVYKKDIEEFNQTMAQSSNTSIIPYEDLDVLHHNFNNSAVVAEGEKAKQSKFVTITMVMWHTQTGLKGSQNLCPMVTLIVKTTLNVARRSVISWNLDGIGKWVQILYKSVNPN